MTTYSTFGGQITKSEAFAKMIHHLREAQSQAAVLSHLHNTEDSEMDKLMARGWLGVSEMLGLTVVKITDLAKKKFQ